MNGTARVKNCRALSARGVALDTGSREFWRLKHEVLDLLLTDLGPLLPKHFRPDLEKQILCELKETVGKPDLLLGIFPVGSKWGQEKSVDIRFKPSLAALRVHNLLKTTVLPALKSMTSDDNAFGLWVPLSQPEMTRKQKRKANTEDRREGRSRPRRG